MADAAAAAEIHMPICDMCTKNGSCVIYKNCSCGHFVCEGCVCEHVSGRDREVVTGKLIQTPINLRHYICKACPNEAHLKTERREFEVVWLKCCDNGQFQRIDGPEKLLVLLKGDCQRHHGKPAEFEGLARFSCVNPKCKMLFDKIENLTDHSRMCMHRSDSAAKSVPQDSGFASAASAPK